MLTVDSHEAHELPYVLLAPLQQLSPEPLPQMRDW